MAVSSTPPPPSTQNQDEHITLSTVSHDILHNHILTRLDGPTLTSLSCASSDLYALLSSQHTLWQNICNSVWPSIKHPLTTSVISTFPSAHRSFFSDSYPLLRPRFFSSALEAPFPAAPEVISAVDVYYLGNPIFSEVGKTDALTPSFLTSPFWLDIVQSEDFVATWVQHQHVGEMDSWSKHLEENITLSWILIDPKGKRAVNMSSKWPVSVQRHWLTGEVLVKFATILGGYGVWSEEEYVECEMVVTCGGEEGEEVRVRDVSMRMEDMEGKPLTGKDGVMIVKEAMERGERRKGRDGIKGARERYIEFLARKRGKIQRNQRRGGSVFDWITSAAGVPYSTA